MIDLVNQSNEDMLVFCGHSLKDQNDLCKLREQISNVSSFVLFEVKHVEESNFLNLKNCFFKKREIGLYSDINKDPI